MPSEALSQLLHYGRTGRYELSYFEVGDTPGRNADRAGNQAKLTSVPLGISAELFDGNGFDGDAWFTIPEGRGGRRWPRPLGSAGRRMGEHPLEIGPTDASRTLMHLMQDDAVARWPYGFTRVYVLTPSPRWSLSNVVAETLQN